MFMNVGRNDNGFHSIFFQSAWSHLRIFKNERKQQKKQLLSQPVIFPYF